MSELVLIGPKYLLLVPAFFGPVLQKKIVDEKCKMVESILVEDFL